MPTTRRRPRAVRLRQQLEARGERAFQAFVRRSDDARLDRAIGSRAGLRILFAAMERQFVPSAAQGFSGDIQYDLRTGDGAVRSWTVGVAPDAARARPGGSPSAELTIAVAVADFARMAAGELDPVKAVLTGRLELTGDFAIALRLGEMFGMG